MVGRLTALHRYERPDVTATYGLQAFGFTATLAAASLRGRSANIAVRLGHVETEIEVPTVDWYLDEEERRSRKHAKIREVLRCPSCTGPGLVADGRGSLRCDTCDGEFPYDGRRFDFLPASLREEFAIVDTANVSSNSYDGEMINLIHRYHDGLILDCGAGSQSTYYPNVVNLEVVAYPSTDVLAVGERLPFADETFDVVASFAVLEHVRDPFVCAAEITRVLKPGGLLYCQVPFLQPVHAYPNHYYNMTQQGLNALFPNLVPDRTGVITFGQPIFSVSWMLNI